MHQYSDQHPYVEVLPIIEYVKAKHLAMITPSEYVKDLTTEGIEPNPGPILEIIRALIDAVHDDAPKIEEEMCSLEGRSITDEKREELYQIATQEAYNALSIA